jgi:monoamine oxidase
MSTYDVAVVGAGLAGAAAACELARNGMKVIILEARDRVGGRALTKPFAPGGEFLEFGGSWITPWQKRIRHYAELTGIRLRPRHPVIEHRLHDGQTLRVGSPCSDPERPAFDRAMAQIKSDSERYGKGETHDLARLSLDAYLDEIGASPAARVHVMAWWTISGNGDPARISAAEFLSSCGYGGGLPEGMIDALAHTLEPGASMLAEQMIARSGAELRLNARVVRIRQTAGAVYLTLFDGSELTQIDGSEIHVRSAILCLPLNVIQNIKFLPPLSTEKATAVAIGHGGRSVKIWIKARGVKIGTLATGGQSGLRWMFAEREGTDRTALIVGFGLADDGFDPTSRDDVAASLQRFFPEATLVAWDWHDWVSDPWSRGTWVALPNDALWIAQTTLWRSQGRVHFASSDYSAHSPGWFEAAILAGEDAAHALLKAG